MSVICTNFINSGENDKLLKHFEALKRKNLETFRVNDRVEKQRLRVVEVSVNSDTESDQQQNEA